MPAPLPPERREAILTAIRAGGQSTRGIGKAHGVSDATVRKIARDAGITDAFSREQTKMAIEANAVDHQAVLAKLAGRAAAVAGNILASFEAMDLQDWLSVSPHTRAIALGICSDKARELAPPSGEAETEAARSVLAAVLEGVVARHGRGDGV